MRITFSEQYLAEFHRRANKHLQQAYRKKLKTFRKNPYDSNLDVHPLSHQWEGHMSFNVIPTCN